MSNRKSDGAILVFSLLLIILFARNWFISRPPVISSKPAAKIVDITVAPTGSVGYYDRTLLKFDPSEVTINAGDTVRWSWNDNGHSVTSGDTQKCIADNKFCSPGDANCSSAPLSNSGTVYTHTFNEPGSYAYFCLAHCSMGMSGKVVVNGTAQGQSVQFAQANYSVNDGAGSISIPVTRAGDTSQLATVDYSTSDGTASERSDYVRASGTLNFASGETQKSFIVLLIRNALGKGNVSLNLTLSNASSGITLGSLSTATVTIQQPPASSNNPIDDATFFVRENYLDFLNREPDSSGLQFWSNQIVSCNGDSNCIDNKRQNVSAAYFLSTEFQQTGFLVYRLYKAAFGNIQGKPVSVKYQDLLRDTQAIGNGVVVGTDGWQQKLEDNKQSFINKFIVRDAFTRLYASTLSAQQYVDALNQNTGNALAADQRSALIGGLNSGTANRATVLRQIAESKAFTDAENNRAFVLMQYFGYLRRNPDDSPDSDFSGYNFWLNKLNSFNGDYIKSEMVRSFIVSQEYRKRFGSQ